MKSKNETLEAIGSNVKLAKKKKRRNKHDSINDGAEPKEKAIKMEDNVEGPTKEHILLCIEALKKVHAEKQNAKGQENLFGDGERVLLQVTGIKLPKDDRKQFLRIVLPHCSVQEPRDVCLIVKDLEKGLNVDHEQTLHYFNELLASKGIDNITQVISLRELKVEYKPFEAKNSLCQKFDIFLVDERIARLVPKFLGKPFYSKKRIPIPVNLKACDLKKEIMKAINIVTLSLSHHGTCSMVPFGNTTMKSSQLMENIVQVNSVLGKRYPGGWKNIRAQHIKTETSLSIPIHVNTISANQVGYVDADIPKKIKRENVSGELSTIPGVEVTITPSGHIKVVKTADPEWDDEKDEAFVDASEDENDEGYGVKVDDNNQKTKTKKSKSEQSQSASKKSKSKKSKLHKYSDSEDDEVNESEQVYMKKVARRDAETPENSERDDEKIECAKESNECDEGNDDESDKNHSNEEESDEEENEDSEENEDASDSDNVEESDSYDEGIQHIKNNDSSDEENSSNDVEHSDEDQYDDQQEIDEENVIVDDDDDDEEVNEISERENMDRQLLKKPIPVSNENDTPKVVKHKKKSKKERRILRKQQKEPMHNSHQKRKSKKV